MKKILFLLPALVLLVSCGHPGPKAPSSWTLPEMEVLSAPVTLTCPDLEPAPNQWIAFRRDVTLDAVPDTAPARIAVRPFS